MKKPGHIRKILVLAAAAAFSASPVAGQTQTFTSNGTYTVPAGVYSIIVECWGAGGGGGSSNTNGGQARAGGGGGGGGYSYSVVSVTPGNNYNVVVGTGGSGGTNGAGSAGGNSTFNATTVLARGGSGGGRGGNGSAGPGATAGTGSTTYTGGNGAGGANATGSGGGGGGAGSGGNGGNASGTTGGSGTASNGGNGGAGRSGSSAAGNNGNNYGGGGSGGYATAGTPEQAGGNGANGYVVITWAVPYYSQASGDPVSLTNWNSNPGGGGSSPANFTASNQAFRIQNGHTMTTTATSWIVSGTNTNVTILSGGTLTESTTAVSLSANTTLQVDNGGTLNHNVNSTGIFTGTATFGNTSTVRYGYGGAQTVYSASYGNLTLSASGSKTTTGVTVNAVLSMEGTATASAAPAYGSNATLQYNTNTSRTAGVEWITPFAASGGVIIANTGTITLNGAKVFNADVPLTINSGASLNTSAANNYGLTFGGNYVNNGGTLSANASPVTISSNAGTQNIAGFTTTGTVSMTKTGGTATLTGNVNGNSLTINGSGGTLNLGSGLTHTFTGTWSSSNGTLNCGSSTLNLGGTTSFTGGTFTCGTGSVNYTSAGAQTVAGVTYNNLSTSNSGTKTLGGNAIVSGIFDPAGSGLSIGANTLTLNGQINCGTITGGAASNITVGGSGSASLSAVTLNNLTINRAVSLCGNVTVGNNLTLTSGTFSIGANTLTLNGPAIAGTPDNLTTTSSSGLVFGGSSSGVQIPSSVVNLNSLTVNNSSGITLNSSITVSGTITMTQGNISNGSYSLVLSNNTSGSLSYSSGTITGKFQRAIGSTASEYLYPVGTATVYNPLKITFTNLTSGQLSVQFQPNDIGTSGLPLNDTGTEIFDRQTTGYWTLTAVAPMASTNYSIKLNYTGFSGVDANARIMTRVNGGNLTLNGAHGSVSSPEISRTGINGISTTTTDFAIGKPNPRITTQPSNSSGCNSSFTVVASGKTPLSYQWQENSGSGFASITNGGIYSGATSSTLAITDAPMTMNGYLYRCVITDPLGYNVTSNSATLALTIVTIGYLYTTDITVDPASGSSDLTDFPLLISITSSPGRDRLRTTANGGHIYNTNGYDVIFTDQNGSKLDHQLESYDGTTGNYTAWVRIPVLSHTATTTIRMHYGNPSVSLNPSVKTVWLSSYRGVWHLNGSDYTDGTVYANDGTQSNTTSVTGRIAGARGFNGTNSYIIVPSNSYVPNNNNQTVSVWGYYSSSPSGNRNLVTFQNQSASSAIQLGFRGGNAVAWKWGGTILVDGGTSPSTNNWHYYVYTYDGTTSRYYIDGAEVDNSTVAPQTSMPSEGNFGRYNDGEYFNGYIDEPRFSMSIKSAGWILTEYNNQNDPANFITIGTESTNNLLTALGVCLTSYTLEQGYPTGGSYSGTGVTGTNFNPSVAGVGTHPVTYSYTDGSGCITNVSKNIVVTAVPAAPTASDNLCCYQNITDLQASGTNLTWYSDAGLTTQAGTGSPFATGKTTAGTYTYYVTQNLNGCQSSSTTVSLTVYNGITINNQPQPLTICAGNNASFTIAAAGYSLTYRWQEDGVNLTDGGIYSGTTTSTLTLTNPGLAKNGKLYRCVVSTTCGASPVNSATALLTVSTGISWTGTVSSDWNATGNWSCGLIPSSLFSATIPNVANKPVISTGATAAVNNLTIDPGSSLTISGNTLQIGGAITNNGTFTATDGTVELNGTAAQSIGASVFSSNTIKNFTVNNAAGVTLLGSLIVTGIVNVQNGSLASGGNLTLASTASGTALINGSGAGSVTGNVTMQRYLPSGYGYKYFSSPFQAATVNEFGDDMDLGDWFPTFYSFDETSANSGWIDYTNTAGTLDPLHGYAVQFGSDPAAKTVDVTGVVNNGSLSATFYNHNNTYTLGFNLAGNPYPSPIDWDAASGWTKTNIDNAIYYFKASQTDEYGGRYSAWVGGVSSDDTVSNIIPSMQGFFIHISDGTYPVTGTLGMNNSVRITDLAHSFQKSDDKGSFPLIRLSATYENDPTATDPLVIYFDEKASARFEGNLDAMKLMNSDYFAPNFYSIGIDGKKLSIDARPSAGGTDSHVKLGLNINLDGYLIFRINDIGTDISCDKVTITDLVTGREQDLLHGSMYRVFLAAGEYPDRFILNLSATVTAIPETRTGNNIFSVYTSHGIIRMNLSLDGQDADNILAISSLTGQVMVIKKDLQTGYHEFDSGLKDGFYIVTFSSGNYRVSRKILIKNL